MRLHTFPPYKGNSRSPMTVTAPDWYSDARLAAEARTRYYWARKSGMNRQDARFVVVGAAVAILGATAVHESWVAA